MESFGILLTACEQDIQLVERLFVSVDRFAQESLRIAVVVPDRDMKAFQRVVGSRAVLMPESKWSHHLLDRRMHGHSVCHVNQAIIKLAFAQQEVFANYLCLNAKTVFIRPFGISDFMTSVNTPFTFVTEDAELRVDPTYEQAYGSTRDAYLIGLRDYLGLPLRPYKTCHSQAVLSSLACNELSSHLRDEGIALADALEICPCEFSWYNFWLERSETIPRIVREPIFKTVLMEHQHLELAIKGIGEDDLARGYVGVLVNPWFPRQHGYLGLDEPLAHTLGRYVTERDLMRGASERVLRRLPRVRRLLGL